VNDIGSVYQLRKLIRETEPDLVSTHSSKAGVVGRMAALWERTPNVHTAHGWAICQSGSLPRRTAYRCAEGAVQRFANGIICVCEADREYAVRSLKLPGDRIAVIHNGCRDPGPVPDPDHEKTGGSSPCRIAFVGRMAWPKQPDALLRFAAAVESPVLIEFFGGGPDLALFRDLAKDLQVEEKVAFHGHVADLPGRLRQCDVFALVSDWEGFPIATLEAMAAGLPVVVSDVGGAGEAVVPGKTGFLIPRGDEKVLFEKLSLLAADDTLRRGMGRAARELFLERFQVSRMTDAVLRFYEDTLRPA
jgi:glycosyltransferase involved in cell wall biosynthesis